MITDEEAISYVTAHTGADFRPTEVRRFAHDTTVLFLFTQNDEQRYARGLWYVTSAPYLLRSSNFAWTTSYERVLSAGPYRVCTQYWDGTFPVEQPFKTVTVPRMK